MSCTPSMLFAHHLLWSVRLWFLALYKELQLGFSAADTCVGNMSSHIHLHAAGAGTTWCLWFSRHQQCYNSSGCRGACSHFSILGGMEFVKYPKWVCLVLHLKSAACPETCTHFSNVATYLPVAYFKISKFVKFSLFSDSNQEIVNDD